MFGWWSLKLTVISYNGPERGEINNRTDDGRYRIARDAPYRARAAVTLRHTVRISSVPASPNSLRPPRRPPVATVRAQGRGVCASTVQVSRALRHCRRRTHGRRRRRRCCRPCGGAGRGGEKKTLACAADGRVCGGDGGGGKSVTVGEVTINATVSRVHTRLVEHTSSSCRGGYGSGIFRLVVVCPYRNYSYDRSGRFSYTIIGIVLATGGKRPPIVRRLFVISRSRDSSAGKMRKSPTNEIERTKSIARLTHAAGNSCKF